ncbi:50S ribosomal protein L9 [Candidatus Parcubacteria bacterium]|nr:50S ribosomal protein L9 [Candidatus Parcubacteria bacterium]
MKVILLQDIENMGKKYDVKNAKDGYARNFLFPKNLAKLADPSALKWLESRKKIKAKKTEQELKNVQETASKLDGLEVAISVKAGEEGQLFESINQQKISEKLKELGFEIKKTQIDLKEPIKEIGEFPIKLKFEHNLEVEIKVIITEEK